MYYEPSWTRILLRAVIVIASVAFLLVPITIFVGLGRSLGRGNALGLIALFQIVFAGAVASFTRARPHEIFGVTLA